ncbi:MAG: hypothetical protein ABF780_02830 [Bifidobacterium aquikefiri]|uniref:Cd efflux system component n=1 Tax=Bifidobacterium aquikefiri TaxID=1653207 RepID=A0A261G606_9BIFI|nr:hypothetical protein [Bifidobacterium aquikefiri]OZG66858.1 Cd efflux system component [Bifidobacterium aquikefiri]
MSKSLDREKARKVPEILAQVICAAAVLCIGEIVCAPFILAMASNTGIALVPWSCIASMLAVFFCYTVGFALFWAIDYVSVQIRKSLRARLAPVIFGLGGFIAYAAWGYFVIPAIFNSLLAGIDAEPLSISQRLAVGFNCAVLGFIAWFVAKIVAPRFSERLALVIVTGVITLILAALGVFYMVMMFTYIAHA